MSEKVKGAARSRARAKEQPVAVEQPPARPEFASLQPEPAPEPEFANAVFDPAFSDLGQDAPQSQPQPLALRHKVIVWFNYVRPDMTSGSTRITVNDMTDIRFEAQLLNVEAEIASQLKFSKVEITNWRSLDG